MNEHQKLLYNALSQELRELREHLEQVAIVLISDDHVANVHVESLQMFDLLAQRADEGAAVLERMAQGFAPDEAVAGIRLEKVQARFLKAVKAA